MSIGRHAERLVDALGAALTASIAESPMRGAHQLGLTTHQVDRLTDRRGAQGWCDGVSFLKAGVIVYVHSPFSRRENFTIAHEIAHWMVDRDNKAIDWLADLTDSTRALEQLCDQIAGRLLVTDETLDGLIASRRIMASDVRALYDRTAASEPVCAIALTRRLHTPGAVVLLSRQESAVTYASLIWESVDERPVAYPWPGQQIPTGHPLHNLAIRGHLQRRSWWATQWNERQTYYVDAVSGVNRIAAIFAETDIWGCESLHLDQPSRRPKSATKTVHCACGFTGAVHTFPHDACGQPFCPNCGTCDCERKFASHQACRQCFTDTPTNDLVDGICSMCR